MMVALESERTKSAALDKKQRKFDQSLAEEKAVSERWIETVAVSGFIHVSVAFVNSHLRVVN